MVGTVQRAHWQVVQRAVGHYQRQPLHIGISGEFRQSQPFGEP